MQRRTYLFLYLFLILTVPPCLRNNPFLAARRTHDRFDCAAWALPNERSVPIWWSLSWADGPGNYNFKWHQILREKLRFGVRGQLEKRCQICRLIGGVRREEARQRVQGEDGNSINAQNVLWRGTWDVAGRLFTAKDGRCWRDAPNIETEFQLLGWYVSQRSDVLSIFKLTPRHLSQTFSTFSAHDSPNDPGDLSPLSHVCK